MFLHFILFSISFSISLELLFFIFYFISFLIFYFPIFLHFTSLHVIPFLLQASAFLIFFHIIPRFIFFPFEDRKRMKADAFLSLSLSLITIEGSKWGSKRCKWARFGTAEAGNWEWVDGRKRSVRVVEAGREGKRSSTRSPSHSKQSCITIYLKSGSATRKWARRLPTQTTSSPYGQLNPYGNNPFWNCVLPSSLLPFVQLRNSSIYYPER